MIFLTAGAALLGLGLFRSTGAFMLMAAELGVGGFKVDGRKFMLRFIWPWSTLREYKGQFGKTKFSKEYRLGEGLIGAGFVLMLVFATLSPGR